MPSWDARVATYILWGGADAMAVYLVAYPTASPDRLVIYATKAPVYSAELLGKQVDRFMGMTWTGDCCCLLSRIQTPPIPE